MKCAVKVLAATVLCAGILSACGGDMVQKEARESEAADSTGEQGGEASGAQEASGEHKTKECDEEWIIESDAPGSVLGDNFYEPLDYQHQGNMITGGNGCIYATDMGLYGGTPEYVRVAYNIYRLKDGEWELFVSHDASVDKRIGAKHRSDRVDIGNLIYYDGYLYYRVLKDCAPGEGTCTDDDKLAYIYRVPEQGGEPEELTSCDNLFYIYHEKIYYRTWNYNADTVSYWEMDPDGGNGKLIYEGKLGEDCPMPRKRFAVGGGCLFLKKGDSGDILAINLESGNRKVYILPDISLNGIYFDGGYIYGYTVWSEGKIRMYRIDAVSGEEEQILYGQAKCAWIKDGYLYYVESENTEEGTLRCTFNRMDLDTKEKISGSLFEENMENASFRMDIVGDNAVIKVYGYDEYKIIYLMGDINNLPESGSWKTAEKKVEKWHGW